MHAAQYEELMKERDALKSFSEAYQKQVSEMLGNPYGSNDGQQFVNNVGMNQPVPVGGGVLNQFTEPAQPSYYQNLNQFAPVGGGSQFINSNTLNPVSYNNNFM